MSGHMDILAKQAFRQNHFLLVDSAKPLAIGSHQVTSLVDGSLPIRTLGGEESRPPSGAKVKHLMSRGYISIPSLFDVKVSGLVDIGEERSVTHRFAGLTGSVPAADLMRLAEDLARIAGNSALSMEMSDGDVYVSSAEEGARIFVELNAPGKDRGPMPAMTSGLYACKGSGPVHLVGDVKAIVVSRLPVGFRSGVHEDTTESKFEGSGMSADAMAVLRLRITKEDNDALFLQKGEAIPSRPIPEHGVVMRALSGAVGVWREDKIIQVLDADVGVTLLCHPEAPAVKLMATTDTARVLKVPFKLS